MDLVSSTGLAAPNASSLKTAFLDEKISMGEQLQAAWDTQFSRVTEALAANWKEQTGRLLEERFTDLASRVSAEIERAAAEAGCQARLEASEVFNRAVRRLRRSETDEEWADALLDATTGLASHAAVFIVARQRVRLLRARGGSAGATEFPLSAAAAFTNVVETGDTFVAARTERELSGAAALFSAEKVFLIPVTVAQKTTGILCAGAGENFDANGLELLAAVAGVALESRAASDRMSPPVTGEAKAEAAPVHEDLAGLPAREQELHLKAQRFARVAVAEMRLYQAERVKIGRARRNLYGAIQGEIDRSREAFRREFLAASPSMVDYLDRELVRTLANDDAALLGGSYPGPLV